MRKYDDDFKEDALKFSNRIGLQEAAKQLQIPYCTLKAWVNSDIIFKSKEYKEQHKQMDQLEKENDQLKKANKALLEVIDALVHHLTADESTDCSGN